MVTSGVLVPVPQGPLQPPQPPGPAATPAAAATNGGAPGDIVTLAAIERTLGARVGPFADLEVEQALLPTEIQVAALRSTAELGGWENLFVLRRGTYAPGYPPPINPPPFDPYDRTRLVKTYTPSSGSLEVDREYNTAPLHGERIELHVLHPEWELRPAVLTGLERCFLFDRLPLVPVDSTATAGDLTGAYPWLTDPSSVWGVEAATMVATVENGLADTAWVPVWGWDAIQRTGGVFLLLPDGCGGWWPNGANGAVNGTNGSLRVLVRRPAWTVVNGLDWAPGHSWADDDVLEVALPYAAAAALVEAWRVARPRLTPLAQVAAAGQVPMWPTPQEAAAEFSRMTARHFRPDVRPPEERLVGPARKRLPGGATGGHAYGNDRWNGAGVVVNR